MGGLHGAEICELVGLYLLSQLTEVMPIHTIGLYRDDGLAVSTATPRQIEILKKKICRIFERNGLQVTIEANTKVVNFLDITLDLGTGTFKPYMKENDVPIYVSSKSNHPPLVLRNIPLGVNRRLSRISSNKEIFDAAKPPYQEALTKSGYTHVLEYGPPDQLSPKKKNRKKYVTRFNPPFSLSVQSNVGREFLRLIDTAFPPNNPLHKLFNRQTVKISYRCMPNMAQAISRHNAKVLKADQLIDQQPGCSCGDDPASCPVQGICKTKGVVYEACVKETISGNKETYTGLTCRQFKTRFNEHNLDMNNPSGRIKSKLSSHIWSLKDRGINYEVTWRLLDKATTFNPTTKKCRLCLKEKYFIMYRRDSSSLNKRSEVFNTCRHRTQDLLMNVKT